MEVERLAVVLISLTTTTKTKQKVIIGCIALHFAGVVTDIMLQ